MAPYVASSRPITACQICGAGALESILFLGYIPPVNTMPPIGAAPEEQPAFPLELLRCGACGHAQIGLAVDAEVLFPYSYPYLSGTTRILRENFAELCREATPLVGLKAGDLVVDIGSNDGTLLGNFKEAGFRALGIEPSQAGEVARKNGIETITAYFDAETVARVKAAYGEAKLITAANVFAHIHDPHAVVEGIVELLAEDGVFVNESHYLASLVETLQYDTIYHEHLRYYHLGAMARLLADHGLAVFHAKRIPTHGGSIRVYAARAGARPVRDSVAAMLDAERAAGITDGSAFADFRRRVVQSKLELHRLLAPIKARGERVYGIGAPSRASTLINYVGIDDGLVEMVMEVPTSHKIGKYIPGTRIPVVDEKALFEDQPPYALMLSWHVGEELMALLRRKGYRGKFIMPLPEPRIVD